MNTVKAPQNITPRNMLDDHNFEVLFHGDAANYLRQMVVKRKSDFTLWACYYRLYRDEGDMEMDDCADWFSVRAVEKRITVYEKV